MRLYEDEILVHCTMGTPKASNGRLSVELNAKAWTIHHSWPMWAIKINDQLILN